MQISPNQQTTQSISAPTASDPIASLLMADLTFVSAVKRQDVTAAAIAAAKVAKVGLGTNFSSTRADHS